MAQKYHTHYRFLEGKKHIRLMRDSFEKMPKIYCSPGGDHLMVKDFKFAKTFLSDEDQTLFDSCCLPSQTGKKSCEKFMLKVLKFIYDSYLKIFGWTQPTDNPINRICVFSSQQT